MKLESVFAAIVILILLTIFTGCGTTSSVMQKNLSAEDRRDINKLGIVFSATPRFSLDIDAPLQSSYIYVPQGLTFGQSLGYVSALAAFDVLFGTSEKDIEDELSFQLTESMKGWNYPQIFLNTLLEEIGKDNLIKITYILGNLTQDSLLAKANEFKRQSIDAIMDIHLTIYGLQSKSGGLAIYTRATVELLSLAKNEVIAARTITFNADQARGLHSNNVAYFRNLKNKSSNTEHDYYNIDPNTIFFFPFETKTMKDYLTNEGELFKQYLKLAALEMSREIINLWGFNSKSDEKWRENYMMYPLGWYN